MSKDKRELTPEIDRLTFVCGRFDAAKRFAVNRGIPPEDFRFVQDWINFAGYEGKNKILWLVRGYASLTSIDKLVSVARARGWSIKHA